MSKDISCFLREVAAVLGEKYVSNKLEDLVPYCRDAFSPVAETIFGKPETPCGVVCPADTQQVIEVIKLANVHNVPIVPITFGSNMGGLALPTVKDSLMLDLSRLDQILEINEENMTATIQPAVSFGRLEQEAQKHGLRTVCKVGGWTGGIIGNYVSANIRPFNARYGWSDPIVSLEVVLPNGDLLRTGSAAAEGASPNSRLSWGPDLTGIWRGSVGSFGIVTKAQVRLYPAGERREFLMYHFEQLDDLLRATKETQRDDIGISVMGTDSSDVMATILDPEDWGHPEALRKVRRLVPSSSWFLFMEVEGFAKRVEADKERVDFICKKHRGKVFTPADEKAMNHLRDYATHKGKFVMHHFNGAYAGIWCIMPLSTLAKFVERVRPVYEGLQFGHVNFPGEIQPIAWNVVPFDRGTTWACGVNITFDGSVPENVEKLKEAISATVMTAMEIGATIPVTTSLLTNLLMPSYANLLREIKKAVDPRNILVPGKIC